ncbi:hypothetical protein ACTSKR_09530 [Chitinibacteraceae bacterium HSL-7]
MDMTGGWATAISGALGAVGQAVAGGPSSAENKSSLTPNVGGEMNVNFGGQMGVGGRSTTSGPYDSQGMGSVAGMGINPTMLMAGGLLLVVLVVLRGRR